MAAPAPAAMDVNSEGNSDHSMLSEVVHHIALPPRLPQKALALDLEREANAKLCDMAAEAAREYTRSLPAADRDRWTRRARMLEHLGKTSSAPLIEAKLKADLTGMVPGDLIALYIHAQNAAIVIRKEEHSTRFEIFEVQTPTTDVMACSGKLLRTFPGPAIDVPAAHAADDGFLGHLAHMLADLDLEVREKAKTPSVHSKTSREVPEPAHPMYISSLLANILRGLGSNANIVRVRKRVADEILFKDAQAPWRRSPVWLIARVALHTSSQTQLEYKSFMAFFLARALRSAAAAGLSNDALHAMRAKLARRMHKLSAHLPPPDALRPDVIDIDSDVIVIDSDSDSDVEIIETRPAFGPTRISNFVITAVQDAVRRANGVLEGRWKEVQARQSEVNHWAPDELDFERDTRLSLEKSRHYLLQLLQPEPGRPRPVAFSPTYKPRIRSHDFDVYADNVLTGLYENHKDLALHDFEAIVQDHALSWSEVRKNDPVRRVAACATLLSCIDQYHRAWKMAYTLDPLDQSTAVLTTVALWVALDRIAIKHCPLLEEYNPVIPKTFLQPLLLRTRAAIELSVRLETHIRRRYSFRNKDLEDISVFTNKRDDDAFANRYFSETPELQELKARIEADGLAKRQRKLVELQAANDKLKQDLQLLEEERVCEVRGRRGGEPAHTQRTCPKCKDRALLARRTIKTLEWPLPADEFEAQAVVFELRLPEIVGIWRSATYLIVSDIGVPDRASQTAKPRAYLSDHEAAQKPGSFELTSRIGLASKVASYDDSGVILPATEEQVFCVHSPSYLLFDQTTSSWAAGPFDGSNVIRHGTLQLDARSPYRYLQYAVDGTSHSSNMVLANQVDCPATLSVPEHIAFGHLRSGPRLQWLNLLNALLTPVLSFRREDVFILCTQAAWQIGAIAQQNRREWHDALVDPGFGLRFIGLCEERLRHVQANWTEGGTVKTLIALVCRLLAARQLETADDDEVRNAASVFLRNARATAFLWLRELKTAWSADSEEDKTVERQYLICEMAAICRMTYDVDGGHLDEILRTHKDVEIALECAMAVKENAPSTVNDGPMVLRVLIQRDQRLSHAIEHRLRELIQTDRTGFHAALTAVWSGYHAGPNVTLESASPWISTKTAVGQFASILAVHYHLITGELLVDGKPLGRLPDAYTTHALYARCFGQRVLDVVPAGIPTMDYATRLPIDGHQIFFALSDRNLRIQAVLDGVRWELVPQKRLEDDFPALLVENYAHWFNPDDGLLEFRPLKDLWRSNASHWRLRIQANPFEARMAKIANEVETSHFLVDIRSNAFEMLHGQVERFERPSFVTITHHEHSGAILELPRFRLHFVLEDSGLLTSRNLPQMCVDTEDQFCGTLLGLRDQLVLRHKDERYRGLPKARCVLIPQGAVEVEADGRTFHVNVSIDTSSLKTVTYHRYDIDERLGYLAHSATGLTTRLFKTYLHAITSGCLPDPLLRRTGTEEALHEMGRAAVKSFQDLSRVDADFLVLIGALSPARHSYPPAEECAQTVTWASDALSSVSQHDAFAPAASSVVQHGIRVQIFQEKSLCDLGPLLGQLKRSSTLLRRAFHRNSLLYPRDIAEGICSAEFPPSPCEDSVHSGRDLDAAPNGDGFAARWAARLAKSGNMHVPGANLEDRISRSSVTITGDHANFRLGYSSAWLSPDLSTVASFLPIYECLRHAAHSAASIDYGLMFSVASLAYGAEDFRPLVPALLAIPANPDARSLAPPAETTFKMADGYEPRKGRISDIIHDNAFALSDTPADDLPRNPDESSHALGERRRHLYDTKKNAIASTWIDSLMARWPDTTPQVVPPSAAQHSWFPVVACVGMVAAYFLSCTNNICLRRLLASLDAALDASPPSIDVSFVAEAEDDLDDAVIIDPSPSSSLVDLASLLRHAPAPTGSPVQHPAIADFLQVPQEQQPPPDTTHLRDILHELGAGEVGSIRRRYAQDLEGSRVDLEQRGRRLIVSGRPDAGSVERYREHCDSQSKKALDQLRRALAPAQSISGDLLQSCDLWPRIIARSLLERLAAQSRPSLTSLWANSLIAFARSIAEHQGAERLLQLFWDGKIEAMMVEFNALSCPYQSNEDIDHLLLEVEGNYRTRPIQKDVAREMIQPTAGRNVCVQLNMGEGKSSVILPMVLATLADGEALARAVVLKPLSAQMFRLLVERLAGLMNRRIFYLPFSRQVVINQENLQDIEDLFNSCVSARGVLIVQPEHILSLKLMSIDRLTTASSPEELDLANRLRRLERYLADASRDVLDESDEILHVQYQLVYTHGQQRPLDGHPDRWTTVLQVLSIVAKRAVDLKAIHDAEVDYHDNGEGTFPTIRLLDVPESEAGITLKRIIGLEVMDGALPNLNMGHLVSDHERETVMRFFTEADVDKDVYRIVHSLCTGMWQGILELRGFLAFGILEHVLKAKRFRVNFGLDIKRTLLAVPYIAKDMPSLRSEFSHPDVSVALTALSYGYAGLTKIQLLSAFKMMLATDNPDVEYQTWVDQNPAVPPSLHELSGINLKDLVQFDRDVVPSFSRNHATINFYLAQVVYPSAAKEFPHKLATSGCDLAAEKMRVTTGFSGTNDRRYLLPTSIEQHDPVGQSSTNAQVLMYLLQPENNNYGCMARRGGGVMTSEEFLEVLVSQTPQIRVLLDVGAQMLSLTNVQLMNRWLSLKPEGVSAAIFVNDKDELCVLAEDGVVELFDSSPYKHQLDKCVVYLDDAHTRGTDLRLPGGSRAAVTLGPKVTKDRLVQGCMRMRQLGHGQSVMFFAPPECDAGIRAAAPRPLAADDTVHTADIVRWVLHETVEDIVHYAPHWVRQNLDYARRSVADRQFSDSADVAVLREAWLASESRTLQEMYGLNPSESEDLMAQARAVPVLANRLNELGLVSLADPGVDEEQEREVSHEIERERQVQRPPKAEALEPKIHDDVRRFVLSGNVRAGSPGFRSLFLPVEAPGGDAWSSNILATTDFARTVIGAAPLSEFLRPVNWVLSSVHDGTLVIFSPYEVNELLPTIRKSFNVHLHMYAPRVSRSMASLSNLRFHAIPLLESWVSPPRGVRLQLDVFAGPLYFDDWDAYIALGAFLGVHTPGSPVLYGRAEVPRQGDGFVRPEDRGETEKLQQLLVEFGGESFQRSPVDLLRRLVSLRRHGMDFIRTHVGQVLHGRALRDVDFT